MKKRIITLALAALFVALGVATAVAMRCENGIVEIGDSKFDVLIACGEPMGKLNEPGPRTYRDEPLVAPIREKWIYDAGRGVYHIVHFNGDSVFKIEFKRK